MGDLQVRDGKIMAGAELMKLGWNNSTVEYRAESHQRSVGDS